MEIGVKDLIYFVLCVVSVVSVWEGMKYKLKKVEDSTSKASLLIFKKDGTPNVMTGEVCQAHRKQTVTDINAVKADVEREARTTQRAFDEIRCLNQNIIRLMLHMKVEPVIYDSSQKGESHD